MDQQQHFGLPQTDIVGDQNEGQPGPRNFGPPGTQGWTGDAYMGKYLGLYFVTFNFIT